MDKGKCKSLKKRKEWSIKIIKKRLALAESKYCRSTLLVTVPIKWHKLNWL